MAARWRENSPEAEALKNFIRGDSELSGRLEALERAAGRRPQQLTDPELTRKIYGERVFLSPTQIETTIAAPSNTSAATG